MRSDVGDVVVVVGGRRVGDLQLQTARGQVTAVERAAHVGDERRVGELPLAHVDRDPRAIRRWIPTLGPTARLLEHPAPDRDQQVGFLGDAEELGRLHLAPRRMVPTQECFETVDAVAPDVDHGLVPDRQLTAVERIDELDAQLQSLEHLLAHAGLEHLEAALAATLGEVHRDVGIADHGVDVVVQVGERDADRGVLEDPQLGADVGRPAHGLDGAAGNRRTTLDRRALEQDRELVAAEAGDGVARPQQCPEAFGDDAEEAVARRMPEAVVDRLEVVEVDAQHGRVRAVRLAMGQRGADAIGEHASGSPGR